ncbi:unnamed protein product [Caenorhabditis sp. 36 PRJEB53466]|nr:unnamed protein product [Caenorhabditis sp. 36 PRJEB53466]
MLLRRSLFVLDICVLLSIVVFLAFMPAERCVHFEANENAPNSAASCNIHPVHHPDFNFNKTAHPTDHRHLVTVCHRLRWSHYKFWDNMYFILLPAITCIVLIVYTIGELCDTFLVVFSIVAVLYTVGVISYEKNRAENNWPFLQHVHLLGAEHSSINVTVPTTWQYSIALCILSALFKIGRILIQHFFGDKKFFLDDDDQHEQKKKKKNGSEEDPVPNGSGQLNESRYSRIETD